VAELVLKELSKTYMKNNKPIPAVKSLNLTCRDGEFVALLGPSGCGKTTTLRMVAGLETVTSGQILIGGNVVNGLPPHRRNIGLAFENYALYPPLTVYENIAFNLKARGVPAAETDREVKRIAELLHITDLLPLKPGALSGGQKQRVNIARAIVRKPSVLLLDEPLSHLDGKMRQRMRTEIKRLHTEIRSTTIIVTHDQSEAMALADRIAVIHEGELQQYGTPLEIFNDPANEFVAGFIGEPPMNLFTVETEESGGEKRFRISGTPFGFPVPEPYRPLAQSGRRFRFGIRPHDIRVVQGDGPESLAMPVTVFENLGEERRIFVRLKDLLLSVVTRDSIRYEPGQTVRLYFRPEKTYLFDPETGRRVRV